MQETGKQGEPRKALIELRGRLEMTQTELGAATTTSQGFVCRAETGWQWGVKHLYLMRRKLRDYCTDLEAVCNERGILADCRPETLFPDVFTAEVVNG